MGPDEREGGRDVDDLLSAQEEAEGHEAASSRCLRRCRQTCWARKAAESTNPISSVSGTARIRLKAATVARIRSHQARGANRKPTPAVPQSAIAMQALNTIYA